MEKPSKKTELWLSASRLKLAQECSWKYFCRYVLKLPDTSNDGARRGSVCHKLFECLLNKRHIEHYNNIVKTKSLKLDAVVYRFINWQMRREGIVTECDNKGNNNFDLIEEMVLVGLTHDFFCEGKNLLSPELEFKFENENPRYALLGYIDKLAEKDGKVFIYDYKTSSEKFEGEDSESNVQAFMYSLYSKKIRQAKAIVEFIFLRHPEDPTITVDATDAELGGFEYYLANAYAYLETFDEKKGRAKYAADQPRPKDGEFKGPLCCGFAKYKGQLKKDGNPMFACPYKWEFDYYVLVDKDGKIINSSFNNDLKASEGQKIETRHYNGCPRFNLG